MIGTGTRHSLVQVLELQKPVISSRSSASTECSTSRSPIANCFMVSQRKKVASQQLGIDLVLNVHSSSSAHPRI